MSVCASECGVSDDLRLEVWLDVVIEKLCIHLVPRCELEAPPIPYLPAPERGHATDVTSTVCAADQQRLS